MTRHAPDFAFTLVVAIRAHEGNPWTLERLRRLRRDYSALPPVVVVDFGSPPRGAAEIEAVCADNGFDRAVVDDDGVFSLARARNAGAAAARTDFILFSDIDFVFTSSAFRKLDELIGTLAMRERIDLVLDLPAYHLGEAATAACEAADDRDVFLERAAFDGAYTRFGGDLEFIAPYSNVFLINRTFFDLVGGYDTRFRGHGSEEFEFMTRIGLVSRTVPIPAKLESNGYGPLRDEFFAPKPYVGHRRMLEAISFPTELTGLKTFHLWHPKSASDDWLKKNDWKRKRLNVSFAAYLKNWSRLLDVDFMPRPRKALCICVNESHWGYFLPLRLAGFSLTGVYGFDEVDMERLIEQVRSRAFDAFAVFNPYMKSHAQYRGLFDAAREAGVDVIIVERGALPGTIYYADDVSYASPSFGQAAFDEASFTDAELEEASAYVADLRRGGRTLERNGDYLATQEKYADLLAGDRKTVFVPLQLEDDMAVRMFLREDAQEYGDFVSSIDDVARASPDFVFIVKPHPLSKKTPDFAAENILLAVRDDNVHRLIDVVDAVLCYNSGVGLITILHGKPCVCVGNAFFCYDGVGRRARSFAEGVEAIRDGVAAPSHADVLKLCGWFIHRKYSLFHADDRIIDRGGRLIHHYVNVAVTRFRWGGQDFRLGRMRETVAFSKRSYCSGRLSMETPAAQAKAAKKASPAPFSLMTVRKTVGALRALATRRI